MTDQFKAFLIAIPCAIIMLLIAAYQYGADHRAKQAEQAATEATRTPEQKIRAELRDIHELKTGQTTDGQTALQLTIRIDLVGIRSPINELLHRASRDIKTIYTTHPDLETTDIQYDALVTNSYGEPSYSPALYIEIDRSTYRRINWQNFNPENLGKIATVQHLRNLNQ